MRTRLVVLLSLAASLTAGAQTTEMPVPFDSAGRILSVNPSLVTRLGLVKPAWPVNGEFVEARLFQVNTGGQVLVVTRLAGSVERYALDEAQAAALHQAFADGIAKAGRVVVEDAADIVSEPARGPFVRDQMVLASILYGPALSSLAHDETAGSGLYLLSVGTSFFAINDFAHKRAITKAQNRLTTDGAVRGLIALNLAAGALSVDLSPDAEAVTTLVGGIGGSIIGFDHGRKLTNSEAQAAMTGSTLAALTALGVETTLGMNGIGDDGEVAAATTLIGGIAGYVVGPKYPRRAPYTVTAGDISVVRLGAILGAAAAFTPLAAANNPDEKLVAGVLTTGFVGGALIADRIAAKPFNHSESDSRMIYLGAVGGGLMGAALPLMIESNSGAFWTGMISGGAIIGAMATQNMMAPPREGAYARSPGSNAGSRLEFQPEGILMAATKQHGNHTLLRIRF
jgi:hypothetical protein